MTGHPGVRSRRHMQRCVHNSVEETALDQALKAERFKDDLLGGRLGSRQD